MNNATTFYIVRHGETDWNVKHLVQGQTDSHLTQKGKDQAHQLAQEIKHIPFSAIYSSDLSRAYDTAKIIAQQLNLPLRRSSSLKEKNFSYFEGRPADEYYSFVKQDQEKKRITTDEDHYHYKFDQICESDHDLLTRVFSYLKKLDKQHTKENILIMCHGGLMSRILIHLGLLDYHADHRVVSNLGYLVLVQKQSNFEIISTKGILLDHE